MLMIDSVELYLYRLPLVRPVQWGHQLHSHRAGLLICLRNDIGEGWGDIAPLPGFSQESFSEAQSQAVTLVQRIQESSWDSFDLKTIKLYPSVRFGFELAQYNLNKLNKDQTAPEQSPVYCCKLLSHVQTDVFNQIELGDYRALKIKVGKQKLKDELEFIHAVCDKYPHLEVRIDANRAWSLNVAKEFLSATRNLSLGYIEEPLKDTSEIADFTRISHIPLALDETLREPEAEQVEPYASVFVLKPTLAGGIAKTLEMIRQARSTHTRYIISSSYESGIGMLGLIELAQTAPDEVHGLDTYDIFEHDVLKQRLSLSGPSLQPVKHLIMESDLDSNIVK